MEQVKISVRNLVEFILRSGDIDNRIGRMAQKEAMQEGSRIHRKIQRRMGASYHAEVPLRIEITITPEGSNDPGKENYLLVIEGRADGIIIEEGQVTVDEIKGSYQDVHMMDGPAETHLAQAKCYAAIYCTQKELECIRVQMTYCNLDTEEIRYFMEVFSREELQQWFEGVIDSYKKWADFQYKARAARQASIAGLEFPFPYREGQRDLAAGVYRTIYRGKNLFIQAPTGTGKTISTVFPAVKAVGEGLAEKIFYLTAKTITRTVAKEAFDLLKGHGYKGGVLTITAKEKMCRCEEMECNPVHCPYAKGHYDRVNEAVFDLLQKTKDMTREVLAGQAEEYQVCPYEMCLDASLWADVIICDYNYVFDPNVYLRRFFAEGANGNFLSGDYIFLIDEAHNLVERGREMYSAELYKEDFLDIKKLLKEYSLNVTRNLSRCNKILLEMKRDCETYKELDNIGHLVVALINLGSAMDEFFQDNIEFPEKKKVLEFYLQLRHFMNMYDRLDENYVIYCHHVPEAGFVLKLYCVGTAVNLQACLNKGKSTIFFSATLLPIQYYKELLSTKEDNYAVYAKSVFSDEQSLLLIGNDVSSKYTRRTESEFERIALYIYQTALAKRGNYMVFFPSYRMMDQVLDKFYKMDLDQVDALIQQPGMNEQQREEFLGEFSKAIPMESKPPLPGSHEEGASASEIGPRRSLVGFCVMGGIFSEGIDLKREQLIGALIVGTGLPQVSNEREILKKFYDARNGEGFDYAFRYPGMNKVQQAAGRVIRTSGDKGVIVLLDERFLQRDYQKMFPREWDRFRVCNVNTLGGLLGSFWNVDEEIYRNTSM